MDKPRHPRGESADRPTLHYPGIGELAESKLRQSAYLALQYLSCEFDAGVLILRGRLPTYYLKQVALALVFTVQGVQQVDDQMEVVASFPSTELRPGPESHSERPKG
jgi:hypothetical protein